MKIRYLAVCVLATAAMSALGDEVNVFRSRSDQVAGQTCTSSGVCVQFRAAIFDDPAGNAMGAVMGLVYDPYTPPNLHIINCQGPDYANVMSLNAANGNTTLKVTLQPLGPGCSGVNFTEPFTIDVNGGADGNVHISNDGYFTQEFYGSVMRGRRRNDFFTNWYQGTVGPYSGPLTGTSDAVRNLQQQQ